MNLGSLFDGIGGFPLAGLKHGIKPIWASEIEKVPIEITKKHLPQMIHLGDITKINGAEIEPVDIITFGSPCQDLSIAGNRKGLAGERSSLFLEAVRIIREMRISTNGKYPKFVLWENVPGAFSSNKGEDFRRVLEEIAETEIPMPDNRKWATAGMAKFSDRGIAWRVLDAQYWGVPQRRKRIFLIADFRANSRPEILFEQESLRRNTKACEDERQEFAEITKSSFEKSNILINSQLVGTLAASGAGLNRPSGNGNMLDFVVCIQGNCIDRADTAGCNGAGAKENVSYTLNTIDKHAVCFAEQFFSQYRENCVATLRANSGNLGGGSEGLIVDKYTIRRLTPLECERLQGFPDNWTAGHSDTARYRTLGNSIAIPCAEFILGGIANESEM